MALCEERGFGETVDPSQDRQLGDDDDDNDDDMINILIKILKLQLRNRKQR